MGDQSLAHNLNNERTEDVKVQEHITFQQMFLSGSVYEGLKRCGFQKPSPIQLKAVPLGRCGFDLIVKSKSGTGKTLVFTLIALEMINLKSKDVQVLIMAPTREIAVQIADVIKSVGCNLKGLKVATFIGGSPEKDDIEKAKECHIAVGAPGRVKSLITKNILKLDALKLFILDEADKLMEKSFQNDVNDIFLGLPIKKQIIATSATFPDDLKQFLGNYMRSLTEVSAELKSPLLLGMKQFFKEVKVSPNAVQEMNNKNEVLLTLLASVSFAQCLIFTNYQSRAETVSLTINRKGWNSNFISAAQSQNKRLEAIKNLKDFKCRILLSTDLTARGIDAANVDLVINYDVPVDVMTYLHRMGRAGRYGAKGVCVTLVSGEKDMTKMRKFLGSIGGASLAVPVIRKMAGKDLNLWETPQNDFEQITGLVEEDEISKVSNEEVISMKYENVKDDRSIVENEKEKNEKINEVESNKVVKSEIRNKNKDIIDKNNGNDEETIEILSNLDINKPEGSNERLSMLEAMASGKFNFETNITDEKETNPVGSSSSDSTSEDKKRKRNVEAEQEDATYILEMMSRGEYDFNKTDQPETEGESEKKMDDNKKRKTSEEGEEDELVVLKNKALYEVAKIVTNRNRTIDDDVERSLGDYLNYTKKEEKVIKENSNVFINAYRFALDDGEHWKSFVSNKELNRYYEEREIIKKQKEDDDNNMEEEEEEYWDEEEDYAYYEEENPDEYPGYDVDENGKRIYAYEHIPNRMEWIPVEETEKTNDTECPKINLLESDDDEQKQQQRNAQNPEYDDDGQTNYGYRYYENYGGAGCSYNYNNAYAGGNGESFCNYDAYSGRNAEFDQSAGNQEFSGENLRNFNREHFESCFRKCSDELWQNGGNFNTVEEFDTWYYDWYGRVQQVTDYVRQNLYVKEMSSFQKDVDK